MGVLITGCSSGIGLATAQALHALGYNVIASCRSEADRARLQDMGLKAILLDVNCSDSIVQGIKAALALSNNAIDVLINNAGFGQAGAVEDLSREVLRQQFETNVFGLMELTNGLIPHMRARGKGRIINISSVLGVVALPFRGAYNASKFALEGLTDTLRLELRNSPIHVSLIEPGPINSHFRDTSVDRTLRVINTKDSVFATNYQTMLTEFKVKKADSVFTLQPPAVYQKILHAMNAKRPKPRYGVTLAAHGLMFLRRMLPTRALDFVLYQISKSEME